MNISRYKSYLNTPFIVQTTEIDNGVGVWKSNKVTIYKNTKVIGEYIRNYPTNSFDTFYPFKVDDVWFALYSANYTTTRVMKLMDTGIEDWCGEEPKNTGFCPNEFYVPLMSRYSYTDMTYEVYDNFYKSDEEMSDEEGQLLSSTYLDFAFISGCIWGDDSFMKLRFIDLRKIMDKQIVIDDRFGHIQLPNRLKLKECIDLSSLDIGTVGIIQQTHFKIV